MNIPNKETAYQCALGQAQMEHLFMCDCDGVLVKSSSTEKVAMFKYITTLACSKCESSCVVVYWGDGGVSKWDDTDAE